MAKKKTGRKRSAVFSTRMDPELRSRVEASAAVHSDGNVSRETERLLKQALAAQENATADISALIFLIEQAAKVVGPKWRTDPWFSDVLRHAIIQMVTMLRPAGKAVAPKGMNATKRAKGAAPDPESYGSHIGAQLFFLMMTLNRDWAAPRGAWQLSMPQAREALRLDKMVMVNKDGSEETLTGNRLLTDAFALTLIQAAVIGGADLETARKLYAVNDPIFDRIVNRLGSEK